MIVTVNKNSWHYRWVKFLTSKFRGDDYYWKDPKSVCPYFWTFVINNLWALFASIGMTVLAILASIIVLSPIWGAIDYYFISGSLLGLKIAAFAYGVASAISILAVIAVLSIAGADRLEAIAGKAEHGKVGVFWGMFFAIKNKVCPMIKYEK